MLTAINRNDRMVQLEDGRILKISGLYTSNDLLNEDTLTDDWDEAVCFTVEFPNETAVLIVEIASLTTGLIN